MSGFKSTMKHVWQLEKGFAVCDIGKQSFVIQFFAESDKLKVLQGSSWNFDDALILLQPLSGSEILKDIKFLDALMWIQVHNLPIGLINSSLAKQIGQKFAGFAAFDDTDPLGIQKFMRVKFLINVDKPLLRGTFILLEGKKHWLDFRYERLPLLCFRCGRLGHFARSCSFVSAEDEKKQPNQYGSWLRAVGRHKLNLSKEERDEEAESLHKALNPDGDSAPSSEESPMQVQQSIVLFSNESELGKRKLEENPVTIFQPETVSKKGRIEAKPISDTTIQVAGVEAAPAREEQ